MLEVKIVKSLDNFRLDVELALDREILSVLGPSGSGKTMTLLCMAGLVRPDEGLIRLNNRILYSSAEGICLPARERKIGFVFQNYALFPHLTVGENIAYGIRNKHKSYIEARVRQLLELIHIPDLIGRYPAEISSGQQQRTALARALAPEPEALLLDEPFSALDTYRRERLEYELLALQEHYNGDVLFVTHDLNQGFKLGNRIAIYDSGTIAQCDSKSRVVAAPAGRTAARLTGVKNLIEGYVTGYDHRHALIEIPAFGCSLKANPGEINGLFLNRKVTVGIRPEHLRIDAKENCNAIPCRAERVVEGILNRHCYYYAVSDVNKQCLLEASPPAGEDLPDFKHENIHNLYFPPENLVIVDYEPG